MNKRIIIKKWEAGTGYKYLMECLCCKKSFELNKCDYDMGKGKFCSRSCTSKTVKNGFQKGHKICVGRECKEETREKIRQSSYKECPKYGAIHYRIYHLKGKPKSCEYCGEKDKRLYWANKDHKYSFNPDDWIFLCGKCHIAYDVKFNNRKTGKGRVVSPALRKKISNSMKLARIKKKWSYKS